MRLTIFSRLIIGYLVIFIVEVSAGAGGSPPEHYAGALTITGTLVPDSKVPVPSDAVH